MIRDLSVWLRQVKWFCVAANLIFKPRVGGGHCECGGCAVT